MGMRPGDPGMQSVGQMCDIQEGTLSPHLKIYAWHSAEAGPGDRGLEAGHRDVIIDTVERDNLKERAEGCGAEG